MDRHPPSPTHTDHCNIPPASISAQDDRTNISRLPPSTYVMFINPLTNDHSYFLTPVATCSYPTAVHSKCCIRCQQTAFSRFSTCFFKFTHTQFQTTVLWREHFQTTLTDISQVCNPVVYVYLLCGLIKPSFTFNFVRSTR